MWSVWLVWASRIQHRWTSARTPYIPLMTSHPRSHSRSRTVLVRMQPSPRPRGWDITSLWFQANWDWWHWLLSYCGNVRYVWLLGNNYMMWYFNSMAPGKFKWNFGYVIFKRILVVDVWGICCEIALIWMLLDFTDDRSTLVQVMAWCCQATSHYLSQCWRRSMSPYGITSPK